MQGPERSCHRRKRTRPSRSKLRSTRPTDRKILRPPEAGTIERNFTLLTESHRKTMPRNEQMQNGRSTVRVLHFPAPTSSATATNSDVDANALADSIRKAWTQKSSPAKSQSGSSQRLPRLADSKI